jgi:uncharacterized C2H2 Zn-finger protein
MARSRRTATKTSSTEQSSGGEFTCPECGKTFTRAASLGAHRQRAHGVSGASKRASTQRSSASRGRHQRSQRDSGSAAGRTPQPTRDGSVNRDRLLQTLFPNGVPPREDVIKRVSSWLDDAERLAKL